MIIKRYILLKKYKCVYNKNMKIFFLFKKKKCNLRYFAKYHVTYYIEVNLQF